MSEHTEPGPDAGGAGPSRDAGHQGRREDLTTHRMRTIGQRRGDAEEKLARHLKQGPRPAGDRPQAAEKSGDGQPAV